MLSFAELVATALYNLANSVYKAFPHRAKRNQKQVRLPMHHLIVSFFHMSNNSLTVKIAPLERGNPDWLWEMDQVICIGHHHGGPQLGTVDWSDRFHHQRFWIHFLQYRPEFLVYCLCHLCLNQICSHTCSGDKEDNLYTLNFSLHSYNSCMYPSYCTYNKSWCALTTSHGVHCSRQLLRPHKNNTLAVSHELGQSSGLGTQCAIIMYICSHLYLFLYFW